LKGAEDVTSERQRAEDRILAATGQTTLSTAYYWLANDAALAGGTDGHRLLRDLVLLNPTTDVGIAAVTTIARKVTASSIDPSAVIFEVDQIDRPAQYRAALDVLANRCKGGRLSAVTADAVASARRDNPFVVEALCAVAGLAYPDLVDRCPSIPGDPLGEWGPNTVAAAFAEIDAIVRGTRVSPIPSGRYARPVELLLNSPDAPAGWAAVESWFAGGISYENLLVQRAVGGAWLAHRNSTSNKLNEGVATQVCTRLDAHGLTYRRATTIGGDTPGKDVQLLAKSAGQTGIVVLDDRGEGRYGIAFSSARDGGTARSNTGKLVSMQRDLSVPIAIVVSGGGWAVRNETANLARAFGGRVYSELGLAALIDDICQVVRN
jgi:hypothetical protein